LEDEETRQELGEETRKQQKQMDRIKKDWLPTLSERKRGWKPR